MHSTRKEEDQREKKEERIQEEKDEETEGKGIGEGNHPQSRRETAPYPNSKGSPFGVLRHINYTDVGEFELVHTVITGDVLRFHGYSDE